MKFVIFSLLLTICGLSLADDISIIDDAMQNSEVIIQTTQDKKLDTRTQSRIAKCMEDYIRKNSKPSAYVIQDRLYDMIHGGHNSKIHPSKRPSRNKTREEIILTLAEFQCTFYHKSGILKNLDK